MIACLSRSDWVETPRWILAILAMSGQGRSLSMVGRAPSFCSLDVSCHRLLAEAFIVNAESSNCPEFKTKARADSSTYG